MYNFLGDSMAKHLGQQQDEHDRREEEERRLKQHQKLEQHRREMKDAWDKKRKAEKSSNNSSQSAHQSAHNDDSESTGLTVAVILLCALTFLV